MGHTQRSNVACDACKRRKVKCNGVQNCNQCIHLGLICHYSAPAINSRSRKSITRGHVIESWKQWYVSQQTVSCQASSAPSLTPNCFEVGSPVSFSTYFFESLIEDYSKFVLPVMPIISGDEFRSAISEMWSDHASSAFVHSLGAITINTTWNGPDETKAKSDLCQTLYTKALEFRGSLMPEHRVTVHSIMIPLIVATCLVANHCNLDMAFYYLREAVTGIQILFKSEPITTVSPIVGGLAQQERLYWLLFVHERYNSIAFHRPAILTALPYLPRPDASIPVDVMNGFTQIISLFKPIDEEFLENWLNMPSPSMTSAWIKKKQADLGDDITNWEKDIKDLTEHQQVDLIVTRHWLRNLVWQMALSRFLLNSDDPVGQECMQMIFPARISYRLRLVLASMPREMVEVHGTGILQKIFDITSTLTDILEHVLMSHGHSQATLNHLEDFIFLYDFLLSMSKFYHVEKALLETRFESICRLFRTSPIISDYFASKDRRDGKSSHLDHLMKRPAQDIYLR